MTRARQHTIRPGELVNSSGLSDDPSALRCRLVEDGYLFFRGLLDPGPVREAGSTVLAALSAGQWVAGSGQPLSRRRVVNTRDALRDPAYLAAISAPQVNRIPYLPPLRATIRGLLGPRAFSYPVKVLRAVFPEAPPEIARGRYIHQDYAVAGVADMLTAWVPLMAIPVELGGLAVLPGSHRGPPLPPRPLLLSDPGWVSTDYQPGDVLVFHCLTSHAALPNSSNRLRVSQDSRWQSIEQIAPARLIYGPSGRRHELFAPRLRRHSWWQPIPSEVHIAAPDPRPAAAPVSRLFPVHSGWSRWSPPAGPVH